MIFLNKDTFFFILLAAILLFTTIPLYDFFGNGPFSWHIQQPAVTEGALELLVIFFISYFSLKFLYKNKIFFSILFLLAYSFYLRRHNIDLAITIDLIYLNSLYFLGSLLLNKQQITYKNALILITGISIWILYSSFLSIFNAATSSILVYSFFSLFFLSLIFHQYSLFSKIKKYIVNIYKVRTPIENPFLVSLLSTILLILFTQSSLKVSYDEVWYSLRGEEVLNQNGSFFEPILMFEQWVHFYPKLYEILIYPLEYFDIYTISRTFTVFIFIFFSTILYELLKKKFDHKDTLLILIALITIPAIANTAIISKPGIISLYIVTLAVVYFLEFYKSKSIKYIFLAFTLLLLSFTTKLTVIAFTGILLVVFTTTLLYNHKKLVQDILFKDTFLYLLFVLVFILVTYRTIHIVGIPFAGLETRLPFISSMYHFLGFEYKSLFQDLTSHSQKSGFSYLEMFMKYNFFPTQTRLIFAWVSNITYLLFFLYIASFTKKRFKLNIHDYLILSVMFTYLYVAYIVMDKKTLGGDGNYYLIPIIILNILLFIELKTRYLKIILWPYIAMHLILLFVTNHSWAIGTHKFDVDLTRSPFNKTQHIRHSLNSIYALDVYNKIQKSQHKHKKVLGDGPENILYLLGASYESVRGIVYFRPYLLSDLPTFIDYLRVAKITHIVYPKYNYSRQKLVQLSERLKKCTNVAYFEGKSFTLLEIKNYDFQKQCFLPPLKRNEEYISFLKPTKIQYSKAPSNIRYFSRFSEKYYQRRSIGIMNGTEVFFDFDLKSNDDKKFILAFKTMASIYNHSQGKGEFIITLMHDNVNVITDKIPISNYHVNSKEYYLGDLSNGNYTLSFKFEEDGWNKPTQLAIINPRLDFHD